jgi:rhamnopyranosyl-N-acetylglucosaminyl-diphospho-decaprenol beta-1,3/1,4-galactofuranosyltransferase
VSSDALEPAEPARPVRIAAVVVTYNRRLLLARCLDALFAQSREIDRVYVVDNASSDGTAELVGELSANGRRPVEHVRLARNVGGAGGFHAGVARAVTAGFDWLWLMDDDGFVEPRCLEKLLELGDRYDVVGPAIVDPDDPSRLNWVFRVALPSGRLSSGNYARSRAELAAHAVDGVFEGDASFFNGVLIARAAIEKVGNVDPGFFIRGDETDYYYRCRIAGLRIATRLDALLHHPPEVLSPDSRKYYYLFRNRVYLHRRYADRIYGRAVARFGVAYILLRYLVRSPSYDPRYLSKLLKSGWAAYRGRLVPWPGDAR